MDNIRLDEIANGAVQEKFERSFKKVLNNMLDINTSYKKERSIVIKLTFLQNEQRDDIKTFIDVTEKLAPEVGIETSFAYGKDITTGELEFNEYGKHIKGQMSFKDIVPEVEVDTETGEIIESSDNVIDLRKRG